MNKVEEQGREIERLQAEIERLRADKDVTRSQERNAAYEADIARLQAENERLRAALKQLVADYEDVPDPTDSDGQEVFARARAALARSDRD